MVEVEKDMLIYQWQAAWLRQIIDLRDTEKSQYFVIAGFQ